MKISRGGENSFAHVVPSPSRGGLGWGWFSAQHRTENHPPPNLPLEGGGTKTGCSAACNVPLSPSPSPSGGEGSLRGTLGMTLIELIVGLAIASLMTITGWRAIDGLQAARDQTVADSARWQGLDTFFATLEADLRRADLNVFRGDANSLSFKLLGNTAAEPATEIRYTLVAGDVPNSSFIRRDSPNGSLTFAAVKNGVFTYRRPPETDPAKPAVTGFESAIDRYPRAVQIELILQSASATTADAERSVSRLMVLR